MSEQAAQVPLIELARAVPNDLCGEWQEIDGLRAWHHAPIGRYVHELCDQITELTARAERLQAELVKAEAERDTMREALQCFVAAEDSFREYTDFNADMADDWLCEAYNKARAALGGLNG